MFYYVYKITNIKDGKYYIGKRKHKTPSKDKYMGSGKLILRAIKKYGRESFTKEILAIFRTNDDAAKLEAELVTKEVVESSMSYNMHEGGKGGWGHVNSAPVEERKNVIAFRAKLASGEIKCGGNTVAHFTEDSYRRIREGSKRGNESPKRIKSEAENEIIRAKMSKASSGSNNSQYGKRSHIHPATKEKIKVKPMCAPEGYILYSEYEATRLKNSNVWFNDGVKNYYIKQNDSKVISLGLRRGRVLNKV